MLVTGFEHQETHLLETFEAIVKAKLLNLSQTKAHSQAPQIV